VPELYNDVFWDNRAFYIGVGSLGTGTLNQQNVVALYDAFTTTSVPSQSATGGCPAPVSYWDIGVRGDTAPNNHTGGLLSPAYSVLTDAADYTGAHNTGASPAFASQYCNGSRVPPEAGGMGYQVPPGISDATVPNPIFNLTPAATVDEGNNWINLAWGPLSLINPVTLTTLGSYTPTSSSSTINYVPSGNAYYVAAPSADFFGNSRKTNNTVDAGAVEFTGATAAIGTVSGGPLNFGNVVVSTISSAQTLTLSNTGTASMANLTVTVTAPFFRPGAATGTCGASLAVGASCTINVVFTPTAGGPATGTATITGSGTVTGSPVALSGTGIAAIRTFTVTPTSQTYPGQVVGTTSAAQTLTVANTGNVTLTGLNPAFGGGPPNQFARAAGGAGGTCTATLAAGASCTYNVVFSPTSAGTFSRTLTFAPTGYTSIVVNLSGTSSAVTLGFSAPKPSLVTGTTTSHSGTVTVTNTSGAAITLASTPVVTKTAGGASSTFTNTGGTCTNGLTVANNGTCTIIVTYNPGTSGTTTATARVRLTDTLAGALGTATQNGPNFNAN
jgi:hypothetical protein